jgi:hypothetical protein
MGCGPGGARQLAGIGSQDTQELVSFSVIGI